MPKSQPGMKPWSERITAKQHQKGWPIYYEIYFHYSLYEMDERLRDKQFSMLNADAPQRWDEANKLAQEFVAGFPGRRAVIYQKKPMIRYGMDAPSPYRSLAPGDSIHNHENMEDNE